MPTAPPKPAAPTARSSAAMGNPPPRRGNPAAITFGRAGPGSTTSSDASAALGGACLTSFIGRRADGYQAADGSNAWSERGQVGGQVVGGGVQCLVGHRVQC